MKPRQQHPIWKSSRPRSQPVEGGPVAGRLLAVVDAGLTATICVAPFIFGGRHDLGRFVFVSLVGITSAVWCLRQGLLPKSNWTRTWAHGILHLAIALVAMQLVPLPAEWLARLSPRTAELLPLWTAGEAGVGLGIWKTISLTPHETTLALAMLVSYTLLFVVLSQRLQTTRDVEKLLNTVAIAAVLMAGFGLLQFFTSNGQFFWCYVQPFRTTDKYAMGSFINRNHFASFLVLGLGPLVRWLVSVLKSQAARRRLPAGPATLLPLAALVGGITIVLLGIALSLSRGGAVALVTATTVLGVIYWQWRLVHGKYLYGLAGVGLVMLGLLSIYGYDELADRFDSFSAGSIEAIDHQGGRQKIWSANWEAIKHGWLTGSGAGSHREICPIYLPESSTKEYTHAENGYLQVATETGIGGVTLLAVGIGLCGAWCITCLRRLDDVSQQLCFGATAAGLTASLVHSLVDFVWYIPACMSVTLVLGVSTLRLAQLSLPSESQPKTLAGFARPRWWEIAALATILAAWTMYSFFGPGIAAVHWDRYLRDSVAGANLYDEQLVSVRAGDAASEAAMREPLIDSMVHHLEEAVRWDPTFARAHLRLAARYVQRFEYDQMDADNAMTLSQFRDAAQAAKFSSPEEVRAWLDRACGPNAELLDRAYAHARRAVALSPLEGQAYIYLADLGFISGDKPPAADSYLVQALRVRPYDGDVIFEVGTQALLKGDLETAINEWSKCFPNSGPHQYRIVSRLAGRIPASVFLAHFQPDWRTLREVWARYRPLQNSRDLADLVAYAANVTERDAQTKNGIPPVYIWLWQSSMYADLDQKDHVLACLEQAYRSNQHVYDVRYRLGFALMDAGRNSEAEPHLRWCLARRPEAKDLRAALFQITNPQLAKREPAEIPSNAAGSLRR